MPIVPEEELKKEAEEERFKEEQREEERIALFIKYKNLFKSENGIEVLEDLAKFCGYNRSSCGNRNEPYDTFFNEGMRNVYLYIWQMIKTELPK